MRTRVKICGITRPEDGVSAAGFGVDAIGLNFFAPSPRAITVSRAQAIIQELPPFITVVGLFVDAPEAQIRGVLAGIHLDMLQFHGRERPAECGIYALPYIKAVGMRKGIDVCGMEVQYQGARGLLLDTYKEGAPGGTGEQFDWAGIPQTGLHKPFILAGGLTPANVAQAITTVRPYAVDVSSGVEAAKGIKDEGKIKAFMEAIKTAESRG